MASILIIDDEHSLVESLSEILSWEGHRVTSAASGQAGLALLDEHAPDLVLLDHMMPLMTGLEVLKRLRSHPRHGGIAVIMMTAAPLRRVDGAPRWDALLRKPFDGDTLRRAINQVLAGRLSTPSAG